MRRSWAAAAAAHACSEAPTHTAPAPPQTPQTQVVVFNRGLVEQQGSPSSIITAPQTPFIMKFVGDTNVVPSGCLLVKRVRFATNKSSVMFRPTDLEVGGAAGGWGQSGPGWLAGWLGRLTGWLGGWVGG